MRRLKATFVLAVCAMAAACAFGAYTPLIPSEEAVLPLGTFRIADTYVQDNDDLTRWDRSGSEGAYEHYAIRQEGNFYWLDENARLVFAPLEGGTGEYLMEVASPDEDSKDGYVYNYAVGKLVGNRLFMKLPDCDDLPIDTMNELALDADCTLTSYEDLKRVIAETKDAAAYKTYYQLR
jgi:hypothetical protein